MNNFNRPALAVTSINAILAHPVLPAGEMEKHASRNFLASGHLPPLNQIQKRKAVELDSEDEEDREDRRYPVTENCDQIRRKINIFVQSGEMKIGKFQEALGVNSKGFNNFLALVGRTKGIRSNTYYAASTFFKKREAQGIKPIKKRVKKGEEKEDDLSAIKLEGEDTISVPVFDSCDEIRKKICAYHREDGTTQAAFLREIAKTYPEPKKIQSKVLNDFLGKKGASAGNTSSVFYASYVFFEKLRIWDNKPKSKHRLQMEEEYAEDGGFDTKHRHDRCYVFTGESIREDKLGKLHVSGGARGGGGGAYF